MDNASKAQLHIQRAQEYLGFGRTRPPQAHRSGSARPPRSKTRSPRSKTRSPRSPTTQQGKEIITGAIEIAIDTHKTPMQFYAVGFGTDACMARSKIATIRFELVRGCVQPKELVMKRKGKVPERLNIHLPKKLTINCTIVNEFITSVGVAGGDVTELKKWIKYDDAISIKDGAKLVHLNKLQLGGLHCDRPLPCKTRTENSEISWSLSVEPVHTVRIHVGIEGTDLSFPQYIDKS